MSSHKSFSVIGISALRVIVCILTVCLVVTALPVSVQAKKKKKKKEIKPKLSAESVSLELGKSTTLKLVKAEKKKKPKWSTTNAGVLSLKKVSKKKYKITARRPGSAKVVVKVGKKKAVCTVKVTVPAVTPVKKKRIPVYSGDAQLDYLMKEMCQSAGVNETMSDELIAWYLYKWVAKHCVYEYEALLKYGKEAEKLYPPHGLKLIYDLSGKEAEIAACKKENDALRAAGKITYSMIHVKDEGRYLSRKDPNQFGSTLECYQRLTGDCRYMASIYTNLCEYMGLRGGINIGKTYSSIKHGFTLHYISFVYIDGEKYYVDPGAAVHNYTRHKKFKAKYYKLSSKQLRKSYRIGTGPKEF